MKFQFLTTSKELQTRVCDGGALLLLIGFLLQTESHVVRDIKLVGFLCLAWGLGSVLVSWGWKGEKIPYWVHLVSIVVFIILAIAISIFFVKTP